MYDYTLHCRYSLEALDIEKNYQVEDCFEVNGKQKIKISIYDLESVLVPKDNQKQNPDESYQTNIKNLLFLFCTDQ